MVATSGSLCRYQGVGHQASNSDSISHNGQLSDKVVEWRAAANPVKGWGNRGLVCAIVRERGGGKRKALARVGREKAQEGREA